MIRVNPRSSSGARKAPDVAKADEAFRTISEVAKELDVPKHVLRFWELKFPQIRPMKRGGGRRYYRPDDARLLRGIRTLLYRDGYTIKGVQKILREQGIEAVKLIGEEVYRGGETAAASEAAPPASGRSLPERRPPARVLSPRRAMEQAVAELEACRALLTGGGADLSERR